MVAHRKIAPGYMATWDVSIRRYLAAFPGESPEGCGYHQPALADRVSNRGYNLERSIGSIRTNILSEYRFGPQALEGVALYMFRRTPPSIAANDTPREVHGAPYRQPGVRRDDDITRTDLQGEFGHFNDSTTAHATTVAATTDSQDNHGIDLPESKRIA
jgi:hypothetical protein